MKRIAYFPAAFIMYIIASPLSVPALGGSGQGGSAQIQPVVRRAIKSDLSPALRSITPLAPGATELREIPIHRLSKLEGLTNPGASFLGPDPARPDTLPTDVMPDPIQNF